MTTDLNFSEPSKHQGLSCEAAEVDRVENFKAAMLNSAKKEGE
jgi:hypothetical protein